MSTVLVIEDDAASRELIVFLVNQLGHLSVAARDGQEGLVQARALAAMGALDAVVCDIVMPGLDGYVVLSAIKADDRLRGVPIIFVTGTVPTRDLPYSLHAGAHDYLQKPLEPTEFLARLTAALRQKATYDELKRRTLELDLISRIDPLTGLYNRRHLEKRLLELRAGRARHNHDLSVLLIDIDHFKTVNDTHGHCTGDAVLIEISRRIRAEVRLEDVPGRFGGEEFMVLLPFIDQTGATAAAERLRRAVSESPVLVAQESVPITIKSRVLVQPGRR